MFESERGRLLVATPDLADPSFFRTVVLVLEHNADGAIGVVLNRPTDSTVASLLPRWAEIAAAPGVVFIGGPVQPDGAIGLVRRAALEDAGLEDAGLEDAGGGFAPLFGDLGTVDLQRDPYEVVPEVDAARVFAGHAGWGPGQLDGELAANGWFVVERDDQDVWRAEPEALWRLVLKRQPGRVSMFADFPADPSMN